MADLYGRSIASACMRVNEDQVAGLQHGRKARVNPLVPRKQLSDRHTNPAPECPVEMSPVLLTLEGAIVFLQNRFPFFVVFFVLDETHDFAARELSEAGSQLRFRAVSILGDGQITVGGLAFLLLALLAAGLAVHAALFIDNARGDFFFAAFVAALFFKLALELLVLAFTFRTRSSWHIGPFSSAIIYAEVRGLQIGL